MKARKLKQRFGELVRAAEKLGPPPSKSLLRKRFLVAYWRFARAARAIPLKRLDTGNRIRRAAVLHNAGCVAFGCMTREGASRGQ